MDNDYSAQGQQLSAPVYQTFHLGIPYLREEISEEWDNYFVLKFRKYFY